MTDANTYLLNRAGITSDHISAGKARQLYDDARDHPESGLEGDLESGFGFWLLSADGKVRLVRCTVTPLLCPHPDAPGRPDVSN